MATRRRDLRLAKGAACVVFPRQLWLSRPRATVAFLVARHLPWSWRRRLLQAFPYRRPNAPGTHLTPENDPPLAAVPLPLLARYPTESNPWGSAGGDGSNGTPSKGARGPDEDPLVSVVVVTHNGARVTQLCLKSLFAFTAYPCFEVVVVDNGSSDETMEILEGWAKREPRVRIIRNAQNLGFPAACNQGARAARGEILVFLNNDTVLTPAWLEPLVEELLRNPKVGLVGPVSNGVANQARVRCPVRSWEELPLWVAYRARKHFRRWLPLPMVALFCAAIRREVWEEMGGLDEDFSPGLFEDDDLSERLREAGYELRCRLDSFVYHFQGASFSKLGDKTYLELYERNRRLFWAKLKKRRRQR
ncbi:MAG: glycosyltransferase family 2 protein [Thermoanaerobaculum sp.]